MTNKKSQSLPPMWFLLLPLILALTSLGCSLSDTLASLTSPTSESRPTARPLPTFTPTPVNIVNIDAAAADTKTGVGETEPPAAEPTETPVPEPSPTPAPPPTDTPVPANNKVTVTVSQDMNVRGGPGTNYPVIGTAPAGASSTAVGRNADASWVQVQYPPGSDNTGWVYVPLVQIDGNLQAVVVVQAPAPPPVAASPPQQQEEAPAPAPPKYQFTPAAWHANGNEAIVHFRGTIRDEGGNPVNGFSVLVDNGSWNVLAHPTGASHHYPDKPDGEWDVVIPDIRTGIGWWTLTVVSYDCPSFEVEFNAQCKQFTRLSEDIRVEVVYPTETIIWADWTCHWDCNKGLYVNAYRRP